MRREKFRKAQSKKTNFAYNGRVEDARPVRGKEPHSNKHPSKRVDLRGKSL